MTTDIADAATPRDDGRALQAKLYREIGVAAVAAALRLTGADQQRPSFAGPVDEPAQAAYLDETLAA